jgi:DNA ligase-1
MSKIFKPQLAPNETVNLDTLAYPLMASTKIDGIRMIVRDGKLFTRSLKPQMSSSIQSRFAFLAEYSKDNNILLDGELYSPSISFSELSGQCRAYNASIAADLAFYCFDLLHEPCEKIQQRTYKERVIHIVCAETSIMNDYFQVVHTKVVNSRKEVEDYFEEVLAQGYEGLILRNPKSGYKFGRGTIKEGIIFKLKPFITMDDKIVDIIQATEVRDGAEKKINELGRSVTSKKKDDRILIEKAAAFVVMYNGLPLKVTIAESDEKKIEIWKHQKNYIGKYVEYKGLKIGMKDLPRSCNTIRMRPDKD